MHEVERLLSFDKLLRLQPSSHVVEVPISMVLYGD